MTDTPTPKPKSSAPLVFTYKRVTKRPSYKQIRTFVGLRRLATNALTMVFDLLDDLCFDHEQATTDPGESTAVHWAVEVEDPWGINPSTNLVCTKIPEVPDRVGAHYEISRLVDPAAEAAALRVQLEPKSEPLVPGHVLRSMRPEQEATRARMRAALNGQASIPPLGPVHVPNPPAAGSA